MMAQRQPNPMKVEIQTPTGKQKITFFPQCMTISDMERLYDWLDRAVQWKYAAHDKLKP